MEYYGVRFCDIRIRDIHRRYFITTVTYSIQVVDCTCSVDSYSIRMCYLIGFYINEGVSVTIQINGSDIGRSEPSVDL